MSDTVSEEAPGTVTWKREGLKTKQNMDIFGTHAGQKTPIFCLIVASYVREGNTDDDDARRLN